jgi:hypothetical protein
MNKTKDMIARIRVAAREEGFLSDCLKRLSEMIENDRACAQISAMSKRAMDNRRLLIGSLVGDDLNGFNTKGNCSFCRVGLESFSLSTAIGLCLELNASLLRHYGQLILTSLGRKENKMFRQLFRANVVERDVLRKEKDFWDNSWSVGLMRSVGAGV